MQQLLLIAVVVAVLKHDAGGDGSVMISKKQTCFPRIAAWPAAAETAVVAEGNCDRIEENNSASWKAESMPAQISPSDLLPHCTKQKQSNQQQPPSHQEKKKVEEEGGHPQHKKRKLNEAGQASHRNQKQKAKKKTIENGKREEN